MRQRLDIADVEAADQDPREVPARARERGVRDAARARRSSRRSCAPTPRCSGSTRTCWSRSTGRTTRRATSSELQPLGPPAAPGRDRRGAGRRVGPGIASALLVLVAVVGVLRRHRAVGERRRRRRRRPGRRARRPPRSGTTTKPKKQKPRAAEAGGAADRARRRRSTCAWTAAPGTAGGLRGHDRQRRRPSTGKRVRVNLGKRDVQLMEERQARPGRARGRTRSASSSRPRRHARAAARRAPLRARTARRA